MVQKKKTEETFCMLKQCAPDSFSLLLACKTERDIMQKLKAAEGWNEATYLALDGK